MDIEFTMQIMLQATLWKSFNLDDYIGITTAGNEF